jgi:integrase
MARELERLTTLQVGRARPGWHHDGGGLYLRVNDDGGRFWYFRYGRAGKRYLGLGAAHTITLADARRKAAECRRLLIDGRDPKIEREAVRAAVRAQAAKQVTFAEAADAYCEAHKAGWHTEKHAREVRETLRTLAEPLGALAVDAVDTTLILKVLQPIWAAKPDAATRLRQRLEATLDYAAARGWRGEAANPARWKGHLDHLLPAGLRRRAVKPHKALPYAELPGLMRRLRGEDSAEARCLEFLILCASRMQEARGARFDEIEGDCWTVPSQRMKAKRPHRVPLSAAALAIIERQRHGNRGPFVFPGRGGGAIGKSTLHRLLFALVGDDACVVHGFRSTFRDWCSECTEFPGDWAELSLAHRVGSDAERAYRRGDLLDQRRKLMDAWARYAAGDTVATLRIVS